MSIGLSAEARVALIKSGAMVPPPDARPLPRNPKGNSFPPEKKARLTLAIAAAMKRGEPIPRIAIWLGVSKSYVTSVVTRDLRMRLMHVTPEEIKAIREARRSGGTLGVK